MSLHEAAHMRRDMHAAKGGRRGDAQRAARGARPAGDEGLRLLDTGEDAGNALVEAESGLGQRNLPGRALEEAGAEPFLQPLDALRDDGWREAERAPGGRHAAGGNHAGEDFEIAEI